MFLECRLAWALPAVSRVPGVLVSALPGNWGEAHGWPPQHEGLGPVSSVLTVAGWWLVGNWFAEKVTLR